MHRSFAVGVLLVAGVAAAADAPAPAPRFDGRSSEAFQASVAAMEAGLGDTARLAFHMRLA
ncbi:MAG: hypothetical protein ACK5Q0_12530, partial [Lysobacteraceae bacterium]